MFFLAWGLLGLGSYLAYTQLIGVNPFDAARAALTGKPQPAKGSFMTVILESVADKIAKEPVQGAGGAIEASGAGGPGLAVGARLRRPLLVGFKTSGFGPRGGKLHAGIDWAAPPGTPVYAAADGTVTQAGWNGDYGNYIRVNHGGISTAYAHLSRIGTRAGAVVRAGQTIGSVGSTGDSTGPHLHFEVRAGDTPVNPELYLR